MFRKNFRLIICSILLVVLCVGIVAGCSSKYAKIEYIKVDDACYYPIAVYPLESVDILKENTDEIYANNVKVNAEYYVTNKKLKSDYFMGYIPAEYILGYKLIDVSGASARFYIRNKDYEGYVYLKVKVTLEPVKKYLINVKYNGDIATITYWKPTDSVATQIDCCTEHKIDTAKSNVSVYYEK